MINFFNKWAQGIIIAVIVASIIEMLLPSNSGKKYIKSIIGIYILYVIIVPVINQLNGKEFNLNINEYVNEFQSSSVETSAIDTNANIKQLYVTNLKTDIKEKLLNKGYNVLNIEISILDNDNMDIEYINLEVEEKQSKNENKENKIEVNINEIEKIEIGKEKQTDQKATINSQEKEKIINFIVDTYNIEKSKVKVN